MTDAKEFEVIIIGGSYAGLSAGMTLGRSLRDVLIIDSGLPCNRQTPHSHNFITHDGEKPKQIADRAKEQVLKYSSVTILNSFATSSEKTPSGFLVSTEKGESFLGRKLVFATGIKDLMPEIKGFSECWGISVIHCPYCHGYEFRTKQTGILANGQSAFHIASLVNNLTDNITILTSGNADFTDEQKNKLNHHRIQIIEKPIVEIEHRNGQIVNVVFDDGSKVPFDAVYASVPFVQHSDIPAQLACELTEAGHIKVDVFQRTTVEGVYACGDNSSPMRSVANAVGSGNLTGAALNKALTEEQF